nr:MAG TPA: hypothetical protein [Caudoviricetes sp.]
MIDESSLCIGESRGVTGGQFSWSNQELAPMKAVELWAHRADYPCVKILWKQRGCVANKMCSLCVKRKLMELQCHHCALTSEDVCSDIHDGYRCSHGVPLLSVVW